MTMKAYHNEDTNEWTADYGKAMAWADRGATVAIYEKTGSTVHPAGTGDRRGHDPVDFDFGGGL